MISNDQGSHHLLIWINRQQIQIGQKNRIYSFQQIKDSQIIIAILNKINHSFFIDLSKDAFSCQTYFTFIEKYLNQVEDLTFKKTYRQQLLQNLSLSELVKLTLYLVMKTKAKEEFVNRILMLQEETQRHLMQQIKRVHGWLQSKLQFDRVYQTIAQLQQQNEGLSIKLRQVLTKRQELQRMRSQIQQQSTILEQQRRKNLNEKNQIMQELAISHPTDYYTMYKSIIEQRNQLITQYSQCQDRNIKIAQQNQDLREKIVEDSLIIDHLNSQISKYKELYNHLMRNNDLFNDCSIEQDSVDKQAQRTLSSTQTLKESIKDPNIQTSFEQTVAEGELDDLGQIMHNYNEDLVSKLQAMYVTIGKLNSQISDLNQQNRKIKKENRQKEKMIARAFQSFQDHTTLYSQTLIA